MVVYAFISVCLFILLPSCNNSQLHTSQATKDMPFVTMSSTSLATLTMQIDTQQTTQTLKPLPSPSVVSTSLILPTATMVKTPVKAEYPTLSVDIQQSCPSVQIPSAPGFVSSGALIMNPEESTRPQALTSQDLQPQELANLPGPMSGIHISPDHNWMASLDYPYRGEAMLYLFSLKEQKLIAIPWEKFHYGFSLDRWLDPQRLVFWTDRVEFDDAFRNVVVYDPFSDLQENGSYGYELNPLPGLPADVCAPEIEVCFGGGITYQVFYSPDLAFLAYLRAPQGDKPPTFVLRNLESGQDTWEVSHKAMPYSVPSWSPNSRALVIPIPVNDVGSQFELFFVDRDGNATQLTHLADVHPVVRIKYPVWSPDGQKIAFWINMFDNEEESPEYQLAIYDTQTQKVTEYCLNGSSHYYYWSLDSQQIVFSGKSTMVEDYGNWHIFLLDLMNNIVFDVAKDAYLAGWMTLP